jgi:hypothetical protein
MQGQPPGPDCAAPDCAALHPGYDYQANEIWTGETNMAVVSTFEDVALPADKIWDVIGDFSAIRKWAVLVKSESVQDTPNGKVRSLVMPDDRVVKERLAASSQYSYTYTMLDRPEMADYRSTVAVIPLDDKNSRIELIVSLSASGDTTEEQITERYTKNLRGNLRAMKKALGLPNDRPS